MDVVKEIKDKISIEEVVGEYVNLKRAGVHLKALCPFHSEKTPSFIVTPERGTYHCFGCGEHGDIFTFLQKMEGIDFKDALQRLAYKAGVEIKNVEFRKKDKSKYEKIYKIMDLALEYYEKQFKNNTKAQDYLKDRGLTDKVLKEFRVGFAPNDWTSIYDYLLSLGFSNSDIESAGLIKKREGGDGYYDRFRSRIMFPIFDDTGRTVAFSGRIFGSKDDKGAKYINSPETEIFKKSDVLYGYNFAKSVMRKADFAIIVEGQADLLAMNVAGFKNAMALSGTALSDKQISLISRFTKNIILALDSDEAGLNSIIKNSEKLFSLGFDVKALKIKEGADPADILKEGGAQAIKDLIKNAEPVVDYLIRHFKILHNHEKYVKVLRSRILPIVAKLDSLVEREIWADKIARSLSVSVESVLKDIENIEIGKEEPKSESMSARAPFTQNSFNDWVYKIIALYHWLDELNENKLSEKHKEEFLNKIKDLLADDFDGLSSRFQEGENSSAAKLALDDEFLRADNLSDSVEVLLKNFEKKMLSYKLLKLEADLKEAESVGNEEKAEKINEGVKLISDKISKLDL